jgi:hypothetical protein
MLIGVKTDRKLKVDFVDVELGDDRGESEGYLLLALANQ